MGKIIYDFRDGLEQEKIVYKDESIGFKSAVCYLLYLLTCWSWCGGWFALFQYSYIFHYEIAMWVYIGCWLAFVFLVAGLAMINLHRKHVAKREKHRKRDEEEKKIKAEENVIREEVIGTDNNKIQTELATLVPNNRPNQH